MNELWIVSACLLGKNCKYNGKNNFSQEVVDFLSDKTYIAVCPEVAGGLSIPRTPCEKRGNFILDKNGMDRTKEFYQGAMRSKIQNATHAILKAKSPSCGKGKIYDGTFSGTLTEGNGVFAELCIKSGITVFTEEEISLQTKREVPIKKE